MYRLAISAAAAAAFLATPALAELDRAEASRALGEAAVLCRGGKALWRVDMCGPMLIADPATREVVANRAGPGLRAVPGGVFVGVLPTRYTIANTAIEWEGRRWTVVMSSALSKTDSYARGELLMHEAWHRVQRQIGFPMNSPSVDYLASTMGRSMVRLEWRALAAALTASDEETRLRAVADALAFREFRRWTEAGPELERQLEMNEGLAAYTGHKLSGRPDVEAHVARMLAGMEKGDSFARSFAYGTGPAYGLLLDRYAPNWRKKLKSSDDLGKLLERALGSRRLGGHVDVTGAQSRYDGEALFREEHDRAIARQQAEAQWTARLVEGPVLRLTFGQMQFSFDPNAVMPLSPHGTVYPSARIVDAWGILIVEGGGALIDPNFGGVAVPAGEAGALSGPGWRLELAPGWRIVPGRRNGDYIVERAG